MNGSLKSMILEIYDLEFEIFNRTLTSSRNCKTAYITKKILKIIKIANKLLKTVYISKNIGSKIFSV